MKYGVIATTWLERLALMANQLPVPVLDVLVAPLKARSIMSGVSLGVFDALRDGPLTAADLAARRQLDPLAVDLLLRVLVVFDYIRQDGERFALSAMARRTMLRDSPRSLVGYVEFNTRQWSFIEQLDSLIRSGAGLDFHATMARPEDWAAYQRAMLELARFDAPVVAARVPVPAGGRQLLDLAGSHGLLGAAICRRHPPLRSLVIDLPAAIGPAAALARAEGIDDLVTHRAGDVLTSDYGHERDVVLLSNILHHFTPPDIGSILRRAMAASNPGATVAIWELEAPRAGTRAGAGDIPALYFRLTSTAGAYHGDDYAVWLRDAGYEGMRIARPVLSPGSVLVTGRKPGGGEKRGRP